jgi:hypothetical protein
LDSWLTEAQRIALLKRHGEIKGAERKAAFEHLIKAGRIDEVPAFLA